MRKKAVTMLMVLACSTITLPIFANESRYDQLRALYEQATMPENDDLLKGPFSGRRYTPFEPNIGQWAFLYCQEGITGNGDNHHQGPLFPTSRPTDITQVHCSGYSYLKPGLYFDDQLEEYVTVVKGSGRLVAINFDNEKNEACYSWHGLSPAYHTYGAQQNCFRVYREFIIHVVRRGDRPHAFGYYFTSEQMEGNTNCIIENCQ